MQLFVERHSVIRAEMFTGHNAGRIMQLIDRTDNPITGVGINIEDGLLRIEMGEKDTTLLHPTEYLLINEETSMVYVMGENEFKEKYMTLRGIS